MLCFSIDKASKITSPVLVIHGTKDEIIDVSHGLAIFERCPQKVQPLWVHGAGHGDVQHHAQYLYRLRQFVMIEVPAIARWNMETRRDVPRVEQNMQSSSHRKNTTTFRSAWDTNK